MPTTGAPEDVDVDVAAVLTGYGDWLERQPLSVRSREAYLAQVRDFVGGSRAPSTAPRRSPIRMCVTGRSGITSASRRRRSGGGRRR